MWCFVHFDWQMCFAPQRRAIFEHRNFENVSFWAFSLPNVLFRHSRVPFFRHENFKKCSDTVSFLTFWLQNKLFATAACHFWTSELPKWLREWGVLYILTCKCASRHSRVPFFTCLLISYLRTRRFSEATFRTSGTTNHWKNTAICDVPDIFRACTFFLVTLHACWSSFCGLDISTLLDTFTLLFNSAYCRKLDF